MIVPLMTINKTSSEMIQVATNVSNFVSRLISVLLVMYHQPKPFPVGPAL
ncbi:hypothetical protein [Leuconostoc mesenteroides]|nr:hypothetical protein [Leuconostoc mesenteroides]